MTPSQWMVQIPYDPEAGTCTPGFWSMAVVADNESDAVMKAYAQACKGYGGIDPTKIRPGNPVTKFAR